MRVAEKISLFNGGVQKELVVSRVEYLQKRRISWKKKRQVMLSLRRVI